MNCSYLKTQKNSLRKVFAVLSFSLFSAFAFGATFTWKGSQDSDWNNDGNWEGGTVPSNSSTVTVVVDKASDGHDPVLQDDIFIKSLEIKEGNRLDAGVHKATISSSFTCNGVYAVQIDNPQPLGISTGTTPYVRGNTIVWGDDSFLEYYAPSGSEETVFSEADLQNGNLYSDLVLFKYKNLYVNLPEKTYKPVKEKLEVSGKAKFNCAKVLTETGDQFYEGKVLLESDVEFASGTNGVYFRKSTINLGTRGHLESSATESGYTFNAVFSGETVSFVSSIKVNNLTVNSNVINFDGDTVDTAEILTTGKQIYSNPVNILFNTVSIGTRVFTASEIEMHGNWINTQKNTYLTFNAPLKIYENTVIDSKGIIFEKDIEPVSADQIIFTVNGTQNEICFYGDTGKVNRFKQIASSSDGCHLKFGKETDTVKKIIKAQTFSFLTTDRMEGSATADLFGDITADTISIKTQAINFTGTVLTAENTITLEGTKEIKLSADTTLVAGTSVTFNGFVIGNKKLTLNSKDSTPAVFTFSRFVGYTGTLSSKVENPLGEIYIDSGKCYFNDEVNINKPFTQTDSAEYYFKKNVVQNDTTGNNNIFNGKIHFNNSENISLELQRPVVFGNDSSDENYFEATVNTLITVNTNNNDVTFNASFKCNANDRQKFDVHAGNGNVVINNALGSDSGRLSDVDISGKNITVEGSIVADNIKVTVEKLYEQKENSIVKTISPYKFTQEAKILSSGQKADAKAIIAGSVISNGTTFDSDVFIKQPASFNTLMGKLLFKRNVYIASSGTTEFTFSSSTNSGIEVDENLILCKGELNLGGNITVKKDLLLLGNAGEGNGGVYSDSYGEADDLFSYFNANRNGKPYTLNVSSLPAAFPDSANTAFPAKTEWNATVTNLGGRTITVYENFYDNGVSLNPTSSWTLRIRENKTNQYIAEAYNAQIAYSTVTAIKINSQGIADAISNDSKPFAKIAAAENCNNSGNNTVPSSVRNTGWDFEPLTILNAYTINDNVLYIEFSQPVENVHNELNGIASKISYDNGQKTFASAWSNAECTTALPTDKNISSMYLKTADGQANRWNTDATGTFAGNEQSTDKGRTNELPVHSTVVPDITIEKATASVYETLRDDAKNRIKLYKGDDRFTGTTDKCSPVLIAVYTGQELHTPYGSSAESQPQYDAHNFIEFQYSEQVNAGTSVTETSVNVQANEALGEITPTSDAKGIVIKGLASLEKGKVVCGERNESLTYEEKTTVHSIYRKFRQTAADDADTAQTHRIRVAVAGYVNGTISVDGKTYNNWKGYIKEAVMPSGKVTRINNSNIKDASGNVLDSTGDDQHKLPQLTVNSENKENSYTAGLTADNSLYGTWDLSRPQFAVWFNPDQLWSDGVTLYKNKNSETSFEIVGSPGSATGTEAKCIEFHIFDNTNNYSAASPHYIPKNGWADADNTIIEYSYDVTGGSRANIGLTGADAKPNRTGGGLRRSSFENANKAFRYNLEGEDSSAMREASSKPFVQYAYSELLNYSKDTTLRTPCPTSDSLYFEMFINETGLSVSQVFNVEFIQDKCFITDLAGNLLYGPENSVMTSLNFTPPQFALTIAAVGKKEMFMLFSKKLGSSILTDLPKLRDNLELVTMDESKRLLETAAHPSSGLAFDTTKNPQIAFEDVSVTCIKFALNKEVTLADIKDTWVRVKKATEQALDNQTGLMAYISPIQDDLGNAMTEYSVHALSDFAVNAVKPLNAYAQTVNTTDPDNPVTITLNTITSFKTDDLRNDLPTESDIFMQANISDPDNKAIAFFSSTENRPVAEQFNRKLNKNIKVWLPIVMPSFTDRAVALDKDSGVLSSAPDSSSNIKFEIQNTEYPWAAGKNVQFIFGIANTDGSLVKIDNDGNSNTEKIPLYALRLKDENDITSLDVWQFKTLGVQKQRGGVIIRNNVINASKNEKTILQIDMPEKDDIKIAVMTVSGSIVKYLHNGSLNQGMTLLEWDGKNKAGNFVARGLYFIRISGGGIDETRKVIVVK